VISGDIINRVEAIRIPSALPTVVSILFGGILTLITAGSLGCIFLRRTPAPPDIVFGVGAVLESTIVFFLLLTHHADWRFFLALGFVALPVSSIYRSPPLDSLRLAGWVRIGAILIFAAYGVWYFVNALAPEISPDGVTYRLGLPSEYVRLRGFPDRITFYDMFPQGIEMLYTVAFALGRHSAAKLVEFGFFIATLPLIFRIGRRLQIDDLASLTAAVFYFCSPVAGVTGSSSYNDAAGVFFALASLYLLLVWRDTGEARYLLPAGLLAGFCCAIKLSGVLATAAALLFVLLARRGKAALAVLAGAVLAIAPWLIRDAVLAHNPVAPFLNSLFPNPWFHADTEKQLNAVFGTVGVMDSLQIPWQLAFGDRLNGTFGPLLLALPIALLGLRRRAGRLLLTGALLLATPWYFNTGARFLMQAIVCAAIVLGMTLPARAAWAAIALQAVLCWPQVIGWREKRHIWRLDDFPLSAALRIIPEADYIKPRVDGFSLARLIERETPPNAKTLALATVANAYTTRDIRVWWQSAETGRLGESLRSAAFSAEGGLFVSKVEWPIEAMDPVRVSIPPSSAAEFDIAELWLFAGGQPIRDRAGWRITALPNGSEAALAFDGNLAKSAVLLPAAFLRPDPGCSSCSICLPDPRLPLATPDSASAGDPDHFRHPAPLSLYPASDSASRAVPPLLPSHPVAPGPAPFRPCLLQFFFSEIDSMSSFAGLPNAPALQLTSA
jgi:Dolichyl-phosphate-mannose-protein mannosyltransferase